MFSLLEFPGKQLPFPTGMFNVSPAELTIFHDIIFAGEKKFDMSTHKEAVNINPLITFVRSSVLFIAL